MGPGRVIGEALVNHADVAAISFTGSVGVGRGIAEACVRQEGAAGNGRQEPQIVLDDADLDQAVELSAQSGFYSTGQRCTASSRLIVTDKIYPAFIEALQARMARIKVGDARAAGTDMGPVVSQAQLEQDLSYVEIAKAEGARLAAGGAASPATRAAASRASTWRPRCSWTPKPACASTARKSSAPWPA
jgi:aldehyde dehydrogenase (NAD+)